MYAWAYHQLWASAPAGLVVILGTAHSPTESLLAVCAKDFETPLGLARCERELAGELTARLGPWITADEFVHRGEHSVEFQAVWLMSVYGPESGFRILPLLCGSFVPLLLEGRRPEEDRDYETGLRVLRDLLGQWAAAHGRVVIVASADLSHVGPQFGDASPVGAGVRAEVRTYDLGLLETAAEGDFEGFFYYVAEAGDRTNVCGLASIYTLLRLLDGSPGRLLGYDQWADEGGRGLVSFASLIFP